MSFGDKLKAAGTASKTRLMLLVAMLLGIMEWAERTAEPKAERITDALFTERMKETRVHAQTNAILTVVIVGALIIVGILVYGEIESSLPAPQNNDLSNASDNATSTFADSMEFAPVILIVLVASIVLAVVQRFR